MGDAMKLAEHIRDGVNVGVREYRSLNYEAVEDKFGCRWVADLCVRTVGGGWSEIPVAVFYQPVLKDPSHSHYLGICRRGEAWMITNAISAADGVWEGIRHNDEIVFSRFRHDFRTGQHGGPAVDGGRDYFRVVGDGGERVTLRIVEDRFVEMWSESGLVAVAPGEKPMVLHPWATREIVEQWCRDFLVENSWKWLTDGVLRLPGHTELERFGVEFQ